MGKSLAQAQREYELMVEGYEFDLVDSDFQLGYAARLREELLDCGYTTLARKLADAIEPYRQKWLKTEEDPNND